MSEEPQRVLGDGATGDIDAAEVLAPAAPVVEQAAPVTPRIQDAAPVAPVDKKKEQF